MDNSLPKLVRIRKLTGRFDPVAFNNVLETRKKEAREMREAIPWPLRRREREGDLLGELQARVSAPVQVDSEDLQVELSTARAMFAEGELKPTDLILIDEVQGWQSLEDCYELEEVADAVRARARLRTRTIWASCMAAGVLGLWLLFS